MTTYYPVPENVEKVTEFIGDPILHPIHQCKKCGHSISPDFAQATGVCGMCHEGLNNIGEYIDKIYSVTYYCNEFADHSLTKKIQDDVKEGDYAKEMAEIIEWGIHNFDNLESADYITPPPRGVDDADINHMKKIGEIVSSNVGIPIEDTLRKAESYTSQKEIDDAKQRLENVQNNIESVDSFEDDPFIIVIDDVATSTGTLKYSGKALINSGADRVVGLAITRSEGIEDLVKAEVYEQDNNGD
jgi:predicted amidophosphoribosyltransferase